MKDEQGESTISTLPSTTVNDRFENITLTARDQVSDNEVKTTSRLFSFPSDKQQKKIDVSCWKMIWPRHVKKGFGYVVYGSYY